MAKQQEQGTHFWFMSFADERGDHLGLSGTTTPMQGMTRMDMFEEIRRTIVAEYPALTDAAPLAFDIQPNKL